jgi:hypothetical protein
LRRLPPDRACAGAPRTSPTASLSSALPGAPDRLAPIRSSDLETPCTVNTTAPPTPSASSAPFRSAHDDCAQAKRRVRVRARARACVCACVCVCGGGGACVCVCDCACCCVLQVVGSMHHCCEAARCMPGCSFGRMSQAAQAPAVCRTLHGVCCTAPIVSVVLRRRLPSRKRSGTSDIKRADGSGWET